MKGVLPTGERGPVCPQEPRLISAESIGDLRENAVASKSPRYPLVPSILKHRVPRVQPKQSSELPAHVPGTGADQTIGFPMTLGHEADMKSRYGPTTLLFESTLPKLQDEDANIP